MPASTAMGHGTSSPILRPGLVRRHDVLHRLSRTVPQPLVLVAAPPGYGKTTALAQWLERDPRAVVWIAVEVGDSDPAIMLNRLAAALDGDDALFGQREPTVPRLLERIARGERSLVVVLDDVHHLEPEPVPDLLVELAAHLPAGSQLVLSGRALPGVRVGRLRAEGRVAELGAADLAFTVEEAGAAVAAQQVVFDEGALRLLVERTEGWPAGVYLAAMARQYDLDLSDPPGYVSGDDAYIADYFRDVMLARLPPDTVPFLLRTAALGKLSAPLCDAVLAADDSAGRLADIERRNLFVVPLDRHRRWYRYHRLFSEALVGELRRRAPGEEQRVHLRAARWYQQEGMIEEAVASRIAGGDRTGASRLVNEHGARLIGQGRIATVRRWLDALGQEAVLGYAPVAVTAAWTSALSGETERAHHQLLAAERTAAGSDPLPDGHSSLKASTSLLRAMMGSQGAARMLLDARSALDLEPPGRRWNSLAATVMGIALMLNGKPAEAVRHFEHVALVGPQQHPVVAALALAELSLLAADDQNPVAAEHHAGEARRHLTSALSENGLTVVVTFVASARAALLRGQPDTARQRMGAAVRHYLDVPPTAFPWLAAQTALVLGEMALELDDAAAAAARLDDARRHLSGVPDTGVLGDRLVALSTAVVEVGNPSRMPSAMALSAAEQRVLRLLPTHLSLQEIGDRLHISYNTVKSHVRAVYRKLQSTTRAQAVDTARELGLLPR